MAQHNRAVPADRQADACTCLFCTGQRSAAAARVAGPAAAILATPADAQRPISRGPVQDESKICDPLDRLASRQIEGRSFVTDGDA